MHTAGHALRNLREGRGGHGRLAIAFLVFGWLVVGAGAVAFRIAVKTPLGSQQSGFNTDTAAQAAQAAHDALLSAILLGALFVASGLLAFYVGFSQHHPRMKTYLSLRKQLPKQQEKATRLAHEAEQLRRSLEHARDGAHRVIQRADDAIALADATIDELKELVRVEIAGHLGMPEATTGLIASRQPSGEDPVDKPVAVPEPRPSSPNVVAPVAPVAPVMGLWSTTPGDVHRNGHGSFNGSR
jgi:hypothetical protein